MGRGMRSGFRLHNYNQKYHLNTVNLEFFARVYFRETSHMGSSVKIKSSRIGEITLSFIDTRVIQ